MKEREKERESEKEKQSRQLVSQVKKRILFETACQCVLPLFTRNAQCTLHNKTEYRLLQTNVNRTFCKREACLNAKNQLSKR